MQCVEAFSADPQLGELLSLFKTKFAECIILLYFAELDAGYPGIVFSNTSVVKHITSCGADINCLEEMGISVSIPEGAIGIEEAQLELFIKPCFTGIFKLPKAYESASPAFLIHPSRKTEFQKRRYHPVAALC